MTAAEEQFVTSGLLTLLFLKEHYADKKIYVLGTHSFVNELQANGLNITETPDNDVSCVVVAYDSELTYEKLTYASKLLLTTEVPFYGTNPDLRCPADFGFIPDCGAICDLLTATTGRVPTYLGKPNRSVVDLCLELTGFTREETLVVGDRLYTDIACGINAGISAIFVLSGEGTMEDLKTSEVQPTHIYENIRALYEDLIKE